MVRVRYLVGGREKELLTNCIYLFYFDETKCLICCLFVSLLMAMRVCFGGCVWLSLNGDVFEQKKITNPFEIRKQQQTMDALQTGAVRLGFNERVLLFWQQ